MEERRQKFKVLLCAVAAGSLMGGLPDVATAAPIDDRSFFDSIPHTFLDFETRGDGSPVNVADGDLEIMIREEYDAFGMQWGSPGAFWGNDPDPDVEAALALAGSPDHVVGFSGSISGFFFNEPVRSIGFAMFVNTLFVTEPVEIRVSLFDGTIVESVFFNQDVIDGQIGDIAFGFVGITTDVGITSVEIVQSNFFAIDDLHFSSVPAPGTLMLLPLAGVAALRRRR